MNKKIFRLAFPLAAILGLNTLNAMEVDMTPHSPRRALSMHDQGWIPAAPIRNTAGLERARALVATEPKKFMLVGKILWKKPS